MDVHWAKVFGRCGAPTGIDPLGRLAKLVVRLEPYVSTFGVFWLVDNGSSRHSKSSAGRLRALWPNRYLVHVPNCAAWLNQVEIYRFAANNSHQVTACGLRDTWPELWARALGVDAGQYRPSEQQRPIHYSDRLVRNPGSPAYTGWQDACSPCPLRPAMARPTKLWSKLSRKTNMTPAHPKSMILNIYGAYGRRLGGWIAVAALVELLGDLGFDEGTARSAISRMKSQRLLEPERRDGRVGYVLTDEAKEVLEDGDRRILARRAPAHLEDGWVLAVFSVPETERHARHVLRSRLTWQGFGNVAPGVWIAPWRLASDARALLVRLSLDGYVDLFHAHHEAFQPTSQLVARWWDLDRLRSGYAEFIRVWSPTLEQWQDGRSEYREAFRDYLGAVASWQRFPYLDPALPGELLPSGWEGQRAAELFFDLSNLLADRGGVHVASVFNRSPKPSHITI